MEKKPGIIEMRGGNLIGKGGYGCIFSPAMHCEGEQSHPQGIVSKYMSKRDAEEEYRLIQPLKSLDPHQTWFLYPENPPCSPAEQTEEEKRENPTHGCISEPGPYALLQMKNGGTSWKSYLPTNPQDFLRTWIHVFDAVERLHGADIAHMDIKSENIVTLESGSRYHTRLIDFGFSFSPDTFQHEDFYTSLFTREHYFPWPFEVKFLDPSFRLSSITQEVLNSFYREAVSRDSGTYPPNVYYTKDGKRTLSLEKAVNLYRTVSRLSRRTLISFVSKKADVYSLGRALSYMYVQMTGHVPRLDTIDLKSKGSQNVRLFPGDPEVELVNNQSIPFFRFIQTMMHLDPFQRPTISHAKRMFLQLPFLQGSYPERTLLPQSPSPSPTIGGKTLKCKRRRGTRCNRRKR